MIKTITNRQVALGNKALKFFCLVQLCLEFKTNKHGNLHWYI